MRSASQIGSFVGGLGLVLVAAGCATTQAKSADASPQAGGVPPASVAPTDPSPGTALLSTDAAAPAATGVLELIEPLEPPVVRFVTDSDRLEPEARESLAAFARRWLARPQQPALRIEGHADERGTEEYNLVLGERRASAVKRYLVALGLPDSKLDTVSYGELRPVERVRDESGWAVNRRAELKENE